MAYEYTDERREGERNAQPDVEVFWTEAGTMDYRDWFKDRGFYYAFGFPGCPWTSEPEGPFTTYQAALDDARRHGDCHEDYAPEQEETEPDYEACASCEAGDSFEDYVPEEPAK